MSTPAPSDVLKVQCFNCNSILLTTLAELKGPRYDCRFCAEDLHPTHTDPDCGFCRGNGYAVVNDVIWICQLGVEA